MSRLPFALPLALLLGSCGSGIWGGIIAGSQGGENGGGQVQPPQVVVEPASVPFLLLPGEQLPVAIRIANFALQSDAFVELRTGELATTPLLGLLPSVQGTVSRFFVDLAAPLLELRVALNAPIPQANLVVDVIVRVDGRTVGQPVKLLLNRPPNVIRHLSAENGDALEVSVDGTSTFRLEARHMTATSAEKDAVGLIVAQRNYFIPRLLKNGELNPDAVRQVRATNKEYRLREDGVSEVSGVAPPTRFPGPVKLLLTDPKAGVTLGKGLPNVDLPTLLYLPKLSGVSPLTTSVVGGVLTSLRGNGLLPAENEVGQFEYLFDSVALTVRKGGNSWRVSPSAIVEDESNEQQIRFGMPPSPDGLPGVAKIELEQVLGHLGPRTWYVKKELPDGAVRYRVDLPVLGPLTSILPGDFFFDMCPGSFRLDAGFGEDLVLLSGFGASSKVTLLRAAGIGTYREAGDPVSAHDVQSPQGVLAGRFVAATRDDLVVVGGHKLGNHIKGSHTWLAAQTGPNSIRVPFVPMKPVFETPVLVADQAMGDFDGDGRPDVVILPDPDSGRAPELWLNVATAPKLTLIDPTAGHRAARLHVADLDGDGRQDVVLVRDKKPRNAIIYWGNGSGGFRGHQVVSYDTDDSDEPLRDRITGIVSYSAGSGLPHRHLCVVGSVQKQNPTRVRPILLPLLFDPKRGQFAPVEAANTLVDELVRDLSLVQAMDIVGDEVEELLVASPDSTVFPIRAFRVGAGRPSPISGGVASDPPMVEIAAMQPAVLRHGKKGRPPVEGLLVLHRDGLSDGALVVTALPKTDKGLSTRLPTLGLSEPLALAVGDLDADGQGGDCAAHVGTSIDLHHSPGPGIYDVDPPVGVDPGDSIPGTLTACAWSGTGDVLCWLTSRGRLEILFPGETKPMLLSKDLRAYLPPELQGNLLDDGSALVACNPNGDAAGDLCVFLQPKAAGARQTALVFLRGDATAKKGENPFVFPRDSLLFPGEARDPAVGDLLNRPSGLEAVLVCNGCLRAAYLETPADRFRRFDSTQHLEFLDNITVGGGARWPVLADLDDDGRDDLAFLLPGERRLDLFLNQIRMLSNGSYLGSKLIAFTGPRLTYLGNAFGLAAADMDGDGLLDLFVASTIERINKEIEPSPCLFRNGGRGTFLACYAFPAFFHGSGVPKAFALFDMDENGLTDVVLGSRVLLCR